MSNVLKRFQGISEMEFYKNADDLRTALSAFLMRDKVVPKKWRRIITEKTLLCVSDMFDHMHDANGVYAYDQELLNERKKHQQECINCCHKIGESMQNAIRNVWWETLHATNSEGEPTQKRLALEKNLEIIADLLEKEERLLKGWKKNSKLLKH